MDDDRIYPPLGIMKLEASISKYMPEIKVSITDDYSLENPEIFEEYDVIGLSVMTPQREEARNIRDTIKDRWPDKDVIIGGPHARHYFMDVMKETEWDYVVPQDGDRAILKILKGTDERIHTDYMTKEEWSALPKIDRLKHEYFLRGYNYTLDGKDSTTMLTATGCPEKCTFCEDAMTAVRWTPIETIREELDDIVELGYKGVYIFDDLFAIAMPKVKPIAEALKERDLIYRCNAQARYFTKWGEDFAKLLSDTGCYEIAFGAETGSQKILLGFLCPLTL